MNSLRTDDIIGAVPRIRHMPKNLQRPQPHSYNHQIDGFNQQSSRLKNASKIIDYDVNYNGGKWQQSYNQNMYGNYPLSQYDPNPFIKPKSKNPAINTQRSKYSRGNEYNNGRSMSEFNNYYDNSLIQTNDRYMMRDVDKNNETYDRRMSLDHQNNHRLSNDDIGRYGNGSIDKRESRLRYQDNLNGIEQKQKKYSRILPKQALVINYEQLKLMNLVQQHNNNNDLQHQRQQNPQKQKLINNSSFYQKVSSHQLNKRLDKEGNNKSESENSKRQKSIFKGIGFNIITNSKYQYNLQTSNSYSSRIKQQQ